MKTPMSSDTKLMKDEECESVDSTKYRGMIGSLLYLTASRPDIMFSVFLCARFQEDPKPLILKLFECLLIISEQIVPRFVHEFYSQYCVKYDLEGQMNVKFVIQNQLFSFTLEELDQILRIPYEGDCSFSDRSLDHLESSVPTGGPYQTNPPSPDEIKLYVQVEREDVVIRICHDQVIDVEKN
ncbi:hypothetical protein Tco_0659292 [Tanacetum coccineum]